MKVCVFNISKSIKDTIDEIVTSTGMYCSRSELVRCAIREYLLYLNEDEKPINDSLEVIHIPNEIVDEEGKLITTYLEYKVMRRLESAP
jgi:metal-responsive CopG/Arc/MetJ family transcriptional regulator